MQVWAILFYHKKVKLAKKYCFSNRKNDNRKLQSVFSSLLGSSEIPWELYLEFSATTLRAVEI
jgi:hypothetical protein